MQVRECLPDIHGLGRFVQFIESHAVTFENGEVAVDHGIEQFVQQIVRPGVSHATAFLPDAVSYRVQRIPFQVFLKRQQKIPTDKETDLLGDKWRSLHHPQDDVECVAVVINLSPLMRVDGVFQREWMEAELLAQLLHHVGIAKPVHVDPRHRKLADERR